jgi:hypothetical protein
MPFTEKTKEELILGSWRMTQMYDDYESVDHGSADPPTVEFRENGTFSSNDGETGPYQIDGSYLVIENERWFIESLDDEYMRLSERESNQEISFRKY